VLEAEANIYSLKIKYLFPRCQWLTTVIEAIRRQRSGEQQFEDNLDK
jgi:hypothetical protein